MSTSNTTEGSLGRWGGEFREFLTDTWLGYAFVIPATLLVAVIILYPTVRGISLAFYNVSFLHPNQMAWAGLDNFGRMASDPSFWNATKNSVILTAVAVALEYLLGLGLALALKEKVPGASVFRSLSLVTWVLPIIVMVVIFRFLMQPGFGLVNIVLSYFGFNTTYWFGSVTWAFPLIIAMNVWRNAPFFAVALMAAMKSIPESYYEAAALDGAGALQRFRYITLPQISYVSMIMIVLHVIFTFNNFSIVYLSTGGGPLGATSILPVYIYKQAFSSFALGYAASMGLVMLVLLLAFTAVYVKLEDID